MIRANVKKESNEAEVTTGGKIKAARKAAKMTQKAVAKELHIDASLISKWENNQRVPTDDDIKKLAAVFKIKPESIKEPQHEVRVSDVAQGANIWTQGENEKGWDSFVRAWNRSVAFRCMAVSAGTSILLMLMCVISGSYAVQALSVVLVGVVIAIGSALWPAKDIKAKLYNILGIGGGIVAFGVLMAVIV